MELCAQPVMPHPAAQPRVLAEATQRRAAAAGWGKRVVYGSAGARPLCAAHALLCLEKGVGRGPS